MYSILSATVLSVILFSQLSSQSEDPYPACHGGFEPRPEICAKFNFMSSEEAVKQGCVNPTNGSTFYDLSDYPVVDSLSPQTIQMASMITNVFEDGGPNFAFASCSDISDLRGYTCGYAGFTTGTGDAEIIVNDYNRIAPNNSLTKYGQRLSEISQLPHCDRNSRGSTYGLEGFTKAWKKEACKKDHKFSDLQRDWVYKNYMLPSARYAAQSGIQSALGQAIFYDTVIQHGFQYVEPDINIVRVLTLTGPRKSDETEQSYLTRFLTTRRELQCCYPDQVWPASGTRSDDLQGLVNAFEANKDLNPPIFLSNFQRTITGKEDITKDIKRCV